MSQEPVHHEGASPKASAASSEEMAPTSYSIEYRPLAGPLQKLDVQRVIDAASDPWFNQTLCEVDGTAVRLGVLKGEFHWHRHDEEDELFLVLEGSLRIELEGRETVVLGPRQAYIVPKGMPHRTVAPERTVVLMLERAGVVATGD